jgi:uncharacterized protein (TIGR03083 family)
MAQPLPPVATVHLFPEERAALLAFLESLSEEQWQIEDIYPGWSLKDVVSHLLSDDFGRLSRGRDGYKAALFEFTTPETFEADLLAWINRQNNTWVQATRRLSPRLLIDLLRWAGEETQAYWQSLDLDATGEPVSWAGPDPAPVWLDVAREFTERWLHQQHIREAAGAPLLHEERIFRPVLDTFARATPHTYRHVIAPDGTLVRLKLTGEGASGRPPLIYDVVRANDRWQLAADASDEPDAEAALPADVAWRLFTKSITPEDARAIATLGGDPTLAAKMLETVSIIASARTLDP